jgi:hypothetical protein
MKPVKLSELIEALEFDSDEFGSWVDLKNGKTARRRSNCGARSKARAHSVISRTQPVAWAC